MFYDQQTLSPLLIIINRQVRLRQELGSLRKWYSYSLFALNCVKMAFRQQDKMGGGQARTVPVNWSGPGQTTASIQAWLCTESVISCTLCQEAEEEKKESVFSETVFTPDHYYICSQTYTDPEALWNVHCWQQQKQALDRPSSSLPTDTDGTRSGGEENRKGSVHWLLKCTSQSKGGSLTSSWAWGKGILFSWLSVWRSRAPVFSISIPAIPPDLIPSHRLLTQQHQAMHPV